MTVEQLVGPTWAKALESEFNDPYMRKIMGIIQQERKKYRVFPEGNDIFKAFRETPLNEVKVVIIGQDPYHTYDRASKSPAANGLAFSITEEYALSKGLQPSLKNIFKELEDDIDTPPWDISPSSDLTRWARQGVFLLNTVLTVREGVAGSHSEIGWQRFTSSALRAISQQGRPIVYIAWGQYAKNIVDSHVDILRDCLIQSPHPSPFSAHRGFFGSKPFSRTNAFLESINQTPIDWYGTNTIREV